MYRRETADDWRVFAELASREQNPGKLMELADKLRFALDEQMPVAGIRREKPVSDPLASL